MSSTNANIKIALIILFRSLLSEHIMLIKLAALNIKITIEKLKINI
jgi:hypothetical protein